MTKKYYQIFLFALLFSCSQMPTQQKEKLVFSGHHYQNNNETIIQQDTAKKAIVISFISPECPCSNSHLKHLDALSQQFKEIQFIGIHSNVNQSKKVAKEKFHELTFPVLRDHHAKIANQLGATKTPHVFVFSNTGSLLYHGGVSNRSNFDIASKFYLERTLEQIHHNQPITRKYARALGCAIARREN